MPLSAHNTLYCFMIFERFSVHCCRRVQVWNCSKDDVWVTRHVDLIYSATMLVSPVRHFNGKKKKKKKKKKKRTSIVRASQCCLAALEASKHIEFFSLQRRTRFILGPSYNVAIAL